MLVISLLFLLSEAPETLQDSLEKEEELFVENHTDQSHTQFIQGRSQWGASDRIEKWRLEWSHSSYQTYWLRENPKDLPFFKGGDSLFVWAGQDFESLQASQNLIKEQRKGGGLGMQKGPWEFSSHGYSADFKHNHLFEWRISNRAENVNLSYFTREKQQRLFAYTEFTSFQLKSYANLHPSEYGIALFWKHSAKNEKMRFATEFEKAKVDSLFEPLFPLNQKTEQHLRMRYQHQYQSENWRIKNYLRYQSQNQKFHTFYWKKDFAFIRRTWEWGMESKWYLSTSEWHYLGPYLKWKSTLLTLFTSLLFQEQDPQDSKWNSEFEYSPTATQKFGLRYTQIQKSNSHTLQLNWSQLMVETLKNQLKLKLSGFQRAPPQKIEMQWSLHWTL